MKKLLKEKEIIIIAVILVLAISLSIVYNLKDSYSVSFSGDMMIDTFPSAITDHKEEIIEVYFISDTQTNIDNRYNQASIKADLSESGNVKGWLESASDGQYKLYVASVGKTYLKSGYNLFYEWENVTKIDFSNIDTSQVTKMTTMFEKCYSLSSIDLSKFNTSQVTDMNGMFYLCSNLQSINLSSFNTSQVTNMKAMFADCSNLQSITFGNNFDTSKVTDMSNMFNDCSSLTTLDLSKFNTNQVTDMGYMFYGCNNLTTLDLRNFDISQVSSMTNMLPSGITKDYTLLSLYNLKTKLYLELFPKSIPKGGRPETGTYLYNKNAELKQEDDIVVTGDYYYGVFSLDGEEIKYITIIGDTDGDGNVKLPDIMKLANYIYKDKTSLSGVYLEAGDYNQDKSYNLVDVMQMANWLYKRGE